MNITIFIFWSYLFKIYNTTWIMPSFGKHFSHHLLLSGLNVNFSVNTGDGFVQF